MKNAFQNAGGILLGILAFTFCWPLLIGTGPAIWALQIIWLIILIIVWCWVKAYREKKRLDQQEKEMQERLHRYETSQWN